MSSTSEIEKRILICQVDKRLDHYCKKLKVNRSKLAYRSETLENLLQRLPTTTAKTKKTSLKAFDKLYTCMESGNYLPEKYLKILKEYIKFCKVYSRNWTYLHLETMEALVTRNNGTKPALAIEELLGIVYNLIRYYMLIFKTEKDKKRFYNAALFEFLKDFFVTLLALYFLNYNPEPVQLFPEFKIMPYSTARVSPEDDLFQQLILKEMLGILDIPIPSDTSPQSLAKITLEYFRTRQRVWIRQDVNGVLRVVKDQSRYMALSSPELRRNFVAGRLRPNVNAIRIKFENLIRKASSSALQNGGLSVYDDIEYTRRYLSPWKEFCDDTSLNEITTRNNDPPMK